MNTEYRGKKFSSSHLALPLLFNSHHSLNHRRQIACPCRKMITMLALHEVKAYRSKVFLLQHFKFQI